MLVAITCGQKHRVLTFSFQKAIPKDVSMCTAQLLGKGSVSMRTLFEAPSMMEPKPLFAIRELRWWVSTGLGEPLLP